MSEQNLKITFTGHRFKEYEVPLGGLPVKEPAAHALFRYYTIARRNYEEEHETIKYENEREVNYNYRQLFSSVATMYGVTPERMAKFWFAVDFTCTLHHLPKLPDEERYRFNRPMEVK